MYLPSLVSPMSMPSLSSSPWMPGAPQRGLSRLIWRISSRVVLEIGGRPGGPWRTFQVQNRQKPLRCQPITVSGLTMTRAERQAIQNWDRRAHRNRSAAVGFLAPDGALEDAELVAQSQDLKLKGRSGPERCQQGCRECANTKAGENRRKKANTHSINQIGSSSVKHSRNDPRH